MKYSFIQPKICMKFRIMLNTGNIVIQKLGNSRAIVELESNNAV